MQPRPLSSLVVGILCVLTWTQALAEGIPPAGDVGNGQKKNKKKCRAVALEGGGDKGAYEAGVLYELVKQLPAEEVQWDVVTGISAGSMITAAMSVYAIGDEKNMADYLLETATNITKSDIYSRWAPGGEVRGLLLEKGMFNTTPLYHFLEHTFQKGVKDRRIVVGATSLTTAKLHTWTEKDDNLAEAVLASTAIPGVFPAVNTTGDVFSDGGVVIGVNVFDAVVRCLEVVDDLSDIIVDVVLCSGNSVDPVDAHRATTLTILMRNLAISHHLSAMRATEYAMMAYPTVDWRFVIYPSRNLPGQTDLDFNKEDLEKMVEIGRADASDAVEEWKQGLLRRTPGDDTFTRGHHHGGHRRHQPQPQPQAVPSFRGSNTVTHVPAGDVDIM
eukprot:GFYU01002201.1.p1 GENE.GFYU01002201.1~~GFYU01002201.1.p1  ORF type:complete len:387 (-),score=81.66 GFYU01002201.1:156-1316(-)